MLELITVITGLVGAGAGLLTTIAVLLNTVKGFSAKEAPVRPRPRLSARAGHHRPSARLRRRAA